MNGRWGVLLPLVLAGALVLLLAGCGGGYDKDCDNQIGDMLAEYGQPEDVEAHDEKDFHSWTYWYWSYGFAVNFTWGSDVKGCEVEKHIFPL